jgi:hypothetical protein
VCNRVWLTIAVGWARSYFVRLVCIVIPNIVGNSKNPLVDVMSWLNISFRNDLRNALFMLVSIKSKFCSESQTRPKILCQSRSDQFLTPKLILFGLAHDFLKQIKCHFWSCTCIAYAFGEKLGLTNMHSHENFVLILYLSCGWCSYSIAKGAATEPRASRVLQPCDGH